MQSPSPVDLLAAGWAQTTSGRWKHPQFLIGRRPKLFTEQDALAILDAAPVEEGAEVDA